MQNDWNEAIVLFDILMGQQKIKFMELLLFVMTWVDRWGIIIKTENDTVGERDKVEQRW